MGKPGIEAALAKEEPVLGDVRKGKDRRPVDVEQLDRGRAVSVERAIGKSEAGARIDTTSSVPEIGHRLGDAGLGCSTPASLVKSGGTEVDGPGTTCGTELPGPTESLEGATLHLTSEPGRFEPVLETKGQCAAQRVETKGRLGTRYKLHALQRKLWNEVELDDIAKTAR